MSPLVSVTICARNEKDYIKSCIASLLNQTFKDYEIIIVDDGSSDNTVELINSFQNERIKCFKNNECIGIAKSRNIAIKHSTGKYIFCTDADCTVNEKWIEEGLSCLEAGYAGVEGRIINIFENYQPTFSTKFLENVTGNHFMTGCVAYHKDIIEVVGGFNEKIRCLSDRDLGLKVIELGKMCFNRNMIAVHPLVTQTPCILLDSAKNIESRVYLFKRFGDRTLISWRVMNPFNLAKIIFPGLILVSFFFHKFERNEDYRLLPFSYLYALLERLNLWKACIHYRVFLI